MADSIKITQLYEHIELYSAGDPALNTLFILGQEQQPLLGSTIQFSLSFDEQPAQGVDELLLIDPPDDASERFKLEGNVAALYTTATSAHPLPTVGTQSGGIAHMRIGQHYLDIYSYDFGEMVYLPPLGLLISGTLGSDLSLPLLGDGSDGQEELDALRQAAGLIKSTQFQLMVPRVGSIENDKIGAMQRLAEDVAYIHSIRRVVDSLAQRGEDFETLLGVSDSLMPTQRSGEEAEKNHLLNLQTLFDAVPQFNASNGAGSHFSS